MQGTLCWSLLPASPLISQPSAWQSASRTGQGGRRYCGPDRLSAISRYLVRSVFATLAGFGDWEIWGFGYLDICSSDTETAVRVGGGVIMIGWVGGILVEWWNTLLYGCNLVFQLNGEGHSMYYIPCALDDCHDCTSTASS